MPVALAYCLYLTCSGFRGRFQKATWPQRLRAPRDEDFQGAYRCWFAVPYCLSVSQRRRPRSDWCCRGTVAAQDVRHHCSEKYQAAKAAGTLNGDTWPQFYSKCTAEARDAAAASDAAAAPPPPDVRHICSEKYQAAKAAGTLNGDAWPQFYSKCAAETKANPPAATAPPPAAEVAPPAALPPIAAAPPPPAPAPAPVVEAPAPPPAAAPAPPPVAAAPEVTPPPVNPLKKPAKKPAASTMAATPAPSTAVFPTAIAPAYANEKPGKARMKTCNDQYKANKADQCQWRFKMDPKRWRLLERVQQAPERVTPPQDQQVETRGWNLFRSRAARLNKHRPRLLSLGPLARWRYTTANAGPAR